MSMYRCEECNHEVSTKALHCPNCGAPAGVGPAETAIPVRRRSRKHFGAGLLAFVAILVILFFLYRNGGPVREQLDAMADWCRHLLSQSHRELASIKS